MERSSRSHLQRLPIVRSVDWEVVVVELDAATTARLDALVQRVRAGLALPASFAKHLQMDPIPVEPSATSR